MYWIRQRRNHHWFSENVFLLSILSKNEELKKNKGGKVDPISKKKQRDGPRNQQIGTPFLPSLSLMCSNSHNEDKEEEKKRENNAHRLLSFYFVRLPSTGYMYKMSGL